jgi:hypothetical protein
MTTLPAPPSQRAGSLRRSTPTASVLDMLCTTDPRLPSALDIDTTRLAAGPRRERVRPAPVAARHVALDFDDIAERRTERMRVLAFGATATVLAVVSAGALRLAL